MKITLRAILAGSPLIFLIKLALLLAISGDAFAADLGSALDLTHHWVGFICLAIFFSAYALVMAEEMIHLRKSKPVLLAAGMIWGLIAYYYSGTDYPHLVEDSVRHSLLEYAELMLFLLVAMTYICAMQERRIFEALRAWLVKKGYGLRRLFWLTGILSFFISPIADNLTTALLMCAVVMAVGGDNKSFVGLACINIVIAANAGGAFSPFGDITTLMVWQKGIVEFQTFFVLFIPSLVNYLVPAAIMQFWVPTDKPDAIQEEVATKRGAKRIILLFLATITTAVCFHSFLHLPPVIGMLTGLAYLQIFGFYLKKSLPRSLDRKRRQAEQENDERALGKLGGIVPFDVFDQVAAAEWDTLLFFCGVVLCVGGLGFLGYLTLASELMYIEWGATAANVTVGVLSAIVDNIPVMFAVLTMQPDMSIGQWLLVTLTAGVGGSMLSIGSAAGVALMGQARGQYTFFGHLKWTPVIALGYVASILTHLWINASYF